jgi:hypothetical protein
VWAATDPLTPDTDDDFLSDGDELLVQHSDPLAPDTDGDTYLDGDEVLEGADPTSAGSRIYAGRWPYRRDKDAVAPGPPDGVEVGGRFLRAQLPDQHADVVDLFDFYDAGPPVLLCVLSEGDFTSGILASWLSGGPDLTGYFEAAWPAGPDVVARGDVRVIEIVARDLRGQRPTADAAARFAESYPNEEIPVLADEDGAVGAWVTSGLYLAAYLLDPDLTVRDPESFGAAAHELGYLYPIVAHLQERFPE